jgi:hypothetical protein
MRFDWGAFMDRLRKYPWGHHEFLAPCPHDGIAAFEEKLGVMPAILWGMLEHFNGAELFIGGLGAGPMLTLFRIFHRCHRLNGVTTGISTNLPQSGASQVRTGMMTGPSG